MDLKKELEQYFDILVDIEVSFDLYKEILSLPQEYKSKFNKITSFLNPMLEALKYKFILETTKLLNKREHKNIYNFIENCKVNKDIFLTELYEEYIYEDTQKREKFLIKKVNIIKELEDFENELNQYSKQISNLNSLRDKVLSHRDKEYFYDINEAFKIYNVKYEDIENLLKIIRKHLNVISNDFDRSIYTKLDIEIDNFKHMIDKL